MPIREFELYHGVVLTKIVRRGVDSLSLIERGGNDAWAAYKINADCVVYVKHASTDSGITKDGAVRYQFTFDVPHINRLRGYETEFGSDCTHVGLVCANSEVAFFSVSDLWQCLQHQPPTRATVRVHIKPKNSLRVLGPLNTATPLIVSRNALDKHAFP